MNHKHLPFYLRNQEFKVQIPNQPSQKSYSSSHFRSEFNESVVLEADDLSIGIRKLQSCIQNPSGNIPDEQSDIVDSISFASSSKHKEIQKFKAPVIHHQRGYRMENQIDYDLRKNNKLNYGDHSQKNIKQLNEKLKLQLNELTQMVQNLKSIQETILMEISICRGNGKIPIFLRNREFYEKMMTAFKEIIAQQIKVNVEKELHKHHEQFKKLLNVVDQKRLLEDCSFKEMDNQILIQQIIKKLEQNSEQISLLKQNLYNAETQCDKTSNVLLHRLEEINQLKRQLSKQKQSNQKSSNSLNFQNPSTFSPDFEQLLRGKDSKCAEITKQIESLKEINQQLIDDKEKLQEDLFTLEQRMIGVEMQVQERVRQGIQEIRPAIEEQFKTQYKISDRETQMQGNNQFFLETIGTLSQEIKKLTEKCKYYENYIRDQSKNLLGQTPKPPLYQQQQHSKDFEQIINKRLAELEMRENTLMSIENQLTFKDKKLKELENKLNKEENQFEKRQRQCANKAEEIEKYLHELNAREEELYLWEKQLNEEEKIILRKINELQRERDLFQNQKTDFLSMMNPYSLGSLLEIQNSTPPYKSNQQQYLSNYSNSMAPKQDSSLQNGQPLNSRQRKFFKERPYSYHQLQPYQATYEEEFSIQYPSHKGFERNYHNMSQQNIHYPYYDSHDMKSREMPLNNSERDINELRQNRINLKQKTSSIRFKEADLDNLNGQSRFNKVSHYKQGTQKLYLSSTHDKKSQMVEEILARRKNQNQCGNARGQSKSPLSVRRNPLNHMFKKSQVRRIKSPLRNYPSSHTLKQVTQRKLKQRYERKNVLEIPSKDISDFYRPIKTHNLCSPTSFTSTKNYPYNLSDEASQLMEKQYTPKSLIKFPIPAVLNINQKLQQLKEEIKKQVRELE